MLAQLDFRKPSSSSQDPVEIHAPSVVSQSLVHPFKYWHEGIQEGIRYSNDIYTFFQSYALKERLKAYEIAYKQSEREVSVCITVSKTHYSIWLSLRSLRYVTSSDRLTVAELQPS